MIWFQKRKKEDILNSSLHDENTFYKAFFKDLASCKTEVIIESPYITTSRAIQFTPIFKNLIKRGVKIYIITRPPDEHDENLASQAEGNIAEYEIMGIKVSLCTGNHHRKLAILDRKILWEGSLNILSQTYSLEIMRRIENKLLTEKMFNFLGLGKFL